MESICEALASDNMDDIENEMNYSVATGATGITDLSVISEHVKDTETWGTIQAEIKDLTSKVGSEIKVVNAQIGETFDPSTCPNVKIQ